MDIIKKILGIVWIALGIYAAYYLITTLALPKLATGKPDDTIAGAIYLFLTPIIGLSLILFGKYSLTGEFQDDKM